MDTFLCAVLQPVSFQTGRSSSDRAIQVLSCTYTPLNCFSKESACDCAEITCVAAASSIDFRVCEPQKSSVFQSLDG